MMGLQISQTYAQIGVDRTPSRFEITSQLPKVELRQNHAKINIHVEHPKIQIDQHDAFASAGLKNNWEMAEEAAQRGREQVMEYIAKKSGDGDTLAAIEHGGKPIASIADRDAFPEREFGLVFIPKVGPKINVTGSLQIEPEKNGQGIHNGVEAQVNPGSVSYQFTPAQVRIFLRQYASIEMNYVEDRKVDTYI